ncbi:MAG TPA: hypothetical protein VFQ80_14655 [Thermomicrobiales bacterium]|nr:hypothetical protein [Thermomicrobiales bacterium]
MPDAFQRQRLLTRLNSLLLAGDDLGALRLWTTSGLAHDADAIDAVGGRMAAIAERFGVADRPAPAARAAPPPWPTPPPAPPRPARAAMATDALAERLRAAIAGGDADAALQLWLAARGAPLPLGLAGRVHGYLQNALGGAIRQAIVHRDDEAILAALRRADTAGIAITAEQRQASRDAARRIETRKALAAALTNDDRAALAALSLSGRIDELGRPPRPIARAIARALAWPHLERALDVDDDATILAAYDPDLFDDDPALPRAFRDRIALAQARTAWLYQVRSALRNRNAATLRGAMLEPPPGAEARLSAVERTRIDRMALRDAAAERLVHALREGPDVAIVAALNQIEVAGAPLPAAIDWAAVRGVVDRITLAEAIRDAAAADPPAYSRLARLLPAARAAGAGSFAPDGLDFVALETDLLRAAHLARLRDALALDDDDAIAHAASPDPYGAVARLPAEHQGRVNRALRRSRRHASD